MDSSAQVAQATIESQAAAEEIPGPIIKHALSTASTIGSGRPKCFNGSLFAEISCVGILSFAVGMQSITFGTLMVINEVIAEDLQIEKGAISWGNSSAVITTGSLLLFFGRFSDLFGRRRVLLASFGGFATCALVQGFCTNQIWFFVMRALQGISCASGVTSSVGILGRIYPKPSPRKNRAYATFSAFNPLGFATGSIASGIAASVISWRASFWFIAIVFAIISTVAFFIVPKDPPRPLSTRDSLKQLDWIGAAIVIMGLVAILLSLSLPGTSSFTWQTPWIPVLLVIGFLLVGMFLFWQTKAPHPLMPLKIWRNKTFALINFLMALGMFQFGVTGFWISLYIQEVLHKKPIIVAVYLVPQCIAGILVNVLAAVAMHRVNNRLLLLLGAIGYTISALLYSFVPVYSGNPYWGFIFVGLCTGVLGADLYYTIANMYVLLSVDQSMQSLAGGVFTTMFSLSSAIGLGLSTAIYNAIYTSPDRLKLAYRAIFWLCIAISVLSGCIIPFLDLNKQGVAAKRQRDTEEAHEERQDEDHVLAGKEATASEEDEK